VRRHRTLGEAPSTRFERDERAQLQALVDRPYSQLAVLSARAARTTATEAVEVQRRPLTVYAQAVR
jgi:hypothetical protein